ncbi:MAG: bifunctional folylpolyglutamate synthase/dihydrofolate synthase [Deltaproteobacteria bacterium]|nr:bifunctional folylpolyglutamate synthase/dihydrofolate synthase [Deltaproteobacteria bacterium]
MGQMGFRYLSQLAPWKGKGGFTLDKMRALMAALGNPQDQYRSVHVAGTNGKGSVSVSCASILGAAGFKVGLNISPHLTRMNERIIVDGVAISDERLDRVAEMIGDVAIANDLELTFFEAITACSFVEFAERGVDWAVIEVGLGGRLDATNVIASPAVCVVTTIDYDHQEILGNSLAQIAKEKAGIFKPSAAIVIGELKSEPREVLVSAASAASSGVYLAGHDFSWNVRNGGEPYVEYSSSQFGGMSIRSVLPGVHQAQNLSVAATVGRLIGVDCATCELGLAKAFWPARLEEIRKGEQSYLIDCAHNIAGIQALGDYLGSCGKSNQALVFGAIETKEWQNMLEILLPYSSEVLIVEPLAPNPVGCARIADFLSGIGVKFRVFEQNYRAVLEYLSGGEWPGVVIAGSMYMVGEIREMLSNQQVRYWERCSTRSTEPQT